MNIHFFNSDPVINATYLDDVRVRKMIVENLQMMSAALHRHNLDDQFKPVAKSGKPYRISHQNHPSTIWSGNSRQNLLWLCDYTEALYMRYKRSGGQAFTDVPTNLQNVRRGATQLPDVGLTPFVNCAASESLGLNFKHLDDVHEAYKLYMFGRWSRDTIKLSWTGVDSSVEA
jgi:hypothetical protein